MNGIHDLIDREYQYGFVTPTSTPSVAPKGLSEDVVRLISAKKHEPEWLLDGASPRSVTS